MRGYINYMSTYYSTKYYCIISSISPSKDQSSVLFCEVEPMQEGEYVFN